MLAEARRQFLDDYGRIRSAEGRGSDESDYYRALPFADITGKNSDQWRIRARTFRHFVEHILSGQRLKILDLGAGNCWLSYRLAELRHQPVAVDIFSDQRDGLRAARHYPVSIPVVEGDFEWVSTKAESTSRSMVSPFSRPPPCSPIRLGWMAPMCGTRHASAGFFVSVGLRQAEC